MTARSIGDEKVPTRRKCRCGPASYLIPTLSADTLRELCRRSAGIIHFRPSERIKYSTNRHNNSSGQRVTNPWKTLRNSVGELLFNYFTFLGGGVAGNVLISRTTFQAILHTSFVAGIYRTSCLEWDAIRFPFVFLKYAWVFERGVTNKHVTLYQHPVSYFFPPRPCLSRRIILG